MHIAAPLVFTPQPRAELHEIESGSVLRLVLLAALVAAALFNKRLLPIAKAAMDGSLFRSSPVYVRDESYTSHLNAQHKSKRQ